jgi:hypothetical protein
LRKKLCQGKSYQLPSIFQSIHQLLEQQLPDTNQFSKRAFILKCVPQQKLPATIEFLRLMIYEENFVKVKQPATINISESLLM